MAKIDLTDRERFALFVQLNSMQVKDRAEGRRLDKVWVALNLDAVAETARRGANSDGSFDHEARATYELTSDQRDSLIEYLDKPMTGGMARLIVRIGDELLRSRDGAPP